MKSVFLSHNHSDKSIVRLIGRRLIEHGLTVWIDEAEIKVGESLIQKISTSIARDVDYLFAFISKNSVNSGWVQKELSIAMNKQIKNKKLFVLPIRLDEVDMPDFLDDVKYADLTDVSKFEQAFYELLIGIDIPVNKVPSLHNLDEFNYLDVIKTDNKILALATLNSGNNKFLQNPDGTRYFEKYVFLIRITKEGIVNSLLFTRNICVGHGVIDMSSENYFRVFLNYKTIEGSYAMNGAMYHIRKENLGIQFTMEIFHEQNWGWFPIINGSDVIHFSFSNYHWCINNEKKDRVIPQEAEEEYINHLSHHSGGIYPNNDLYIAKKIVEFTQIS